MMPKPSTTLLLTGLDHLVLTVSNIPRSVEFYTSILGMDVKTFAKNRTAVIFGQQKINLHQLGQEFEPNAQVTQPGSADLCLLTNSSLDQWITRLQTKGIAIIEGPVQRNGATGPINSIYIRDPDNNLLEIGQPQKHYPLTLVCGAPGVGKTTYAKTLAMRHRALLLDIDTSTERLVQLSLTLSDHNPDDRDSPYFKQHYREPIYQQLFDIAKQNLNNIPVIITGPFTRETSNPVWPQQLQAEMNCPVFVEYLYCDPDIIQQRLIARGNPRDKSKLDNWNQHLLYYQPKIRS